MATIITTNSLNWNTAPGDNMRYWWQAIQGSTTHSCIEWRGELEKCGGHVRPFKIVHDLYQLNCVVLPAAAWPVCSLGSIHSLHICQKQNEEEETSAGAAKLETPMKTKAEWEELIAYDAAHLNLRDQQRIERWMSPMARKSATPDLKLWPKYL